MALIGYNQPKAAKDPSALNFSSVLQPSIMGSRTATVYWSSLCVDMSDT